jgi:hypothetical protein
MPFLVDISLLMVPSSTTLAFVKTATSSKTKMQQSKLDLERKETVKEEEEEEVVESVPLLVALPQEMEEIAGRLIRSPQRTVAAVSVHFQATAIMGTCL